MTRGTLLLVACALLCSAALSARIPRSTIAELSSEGFPSGLKAISSSVQSVLRRHREREEEDRAYAVIRFTVPPSEAEDFEHDWLKLEKKASKYHGDRLEVFDLKKTKLDNLFYLSYSEWSDHKELADHLNSDHFLDFAEAVDDAGIRWQLQILKNLSEDVEEDEQGINDDDDEDLKLQRRRGKREQDEQGGDWDKYIPDQYKPNIPDQYLPKHKKERKRSRRNADTIPDVSVSALAEAGVNPTDLPAVAALRTQLLKRKDLAHVLFYYIVPPGEAEDFVDAWTDTAERVVKNEKGNRIYSLRKVATDNTQFYGYGTWESTRDYLDHFETDAVQDLIDFAEDRNVIWFISPLEKIGHQNE